MYIFYRNYYITFIILFVLLFQYKALENNARSEDSSSFNLVQNDLSSKNFIGQNLFLYYINRNSGNKYLKKRQADENAMRKKQKSFAKKNIKKKVKAKKPQAPKPRPTDIKPPVLKPRPPGPKPPAPRPTTRKPGPKPPTTTKKTTKKPLTGRPIRPTPKPLGPPKPPVILPGKPSTLKPTTTVKPDEFADLKSQLIKDINDLRSKHRAPALNFDQALANRAQKFADEAKDKSKHNIDKGNDASIIYLAKSKEDYKPLSYWTSGSENLEYEELDQLLTLKEFTQLIWIKTTKIGCGISKFDNRGSLITICLLSPKGNIQGQYRENVLIPNQ